MQTTDAIEFENCEFYEVSPESDRYAVAIEPDN